MNITTSNILLRPIAFILVGVLLVSSFGFTADGWQIEKNGKNQSANTDINPPTIELPTINDATNTEKPTIKIPDYVNYLTGLETTEELHNIRPVAVLMNSNTANYGICNADILCELPTENGTTNFLSIISNTDNLWKIGSIANGRDYISNISKFFGATMISDKNIDNTAYDHCDISGESLDISTHSGYFYTEYSNYLYTNAEMLNKGLSESLPDLHVNKKIPYQFNDYLSDQIKGDVLSNKISINYSQFSSTELIYDDVKSEYTLYKNGNQKNDALNGKAPSFANCFILFADSATYDNSNGTRLVMNTIGSGDGYYFTNGTVIKIKWFSDISGTFSITLVDGSPLIINRGSSYIGYVKSSAKSQVTF